MDLGSGIDTRKTIEQLMQVERIPLIRLEEDNAQAKVHIDAWEEVRKRISVLVNQSSLLYSFAGPFSKRMIVSDDPGAITGEASTGAGSIKKEIEVLELAGTHQIQSAPLERNLEIPAGKFQIESKGKKIEINFEGGKPSVFVNRLRADAAKLVEPSKVRLNSDSEMVVLRSKNPGLDGEIRLTDTDGILVKMGFLKKNDQTQKATPLGPTAASLTKGDPNASFTIQEGGKSLVVRGPIRHDRDLAPETSIRFNGSFKPSQAPPEEGERRGASILERIFMGPEISVDVGDIHLEGQQIQREIEIPGRKIEETDRRESGYGMTVFWRDADQERSADVPFGADGEQAVRIGEITGGKRATALQFYSRNGEARFGDLRLTEPQSGDELIPAHVTEVARDARLRIDGVEITRPTNEAITDIIEGASLNLKRVTDGPISVQAKPDEEEIVKGIRGWVESYNDLLKFCRDNSRIGSYQDFKMNRPGGDDIRAGLDELKLKSGIFANDSTIRQLETTLKLITANSYPSSTDPSYRILSDIGITTGEIGKSWEQIKDGYLVLEEEKFTKALNESPESVRELFASDTNDDAITDNGLAFTMKRNLDPYAKLSGGLVTARINMLKQKISDNKDRIAQKEESLKKTEESLRNKFGRMESSIKQSRATGNYLKSQMRAEE
jgi:flagellar hook-associated protein 2